MRYTLHVRRGPRSADAPLVHLARDGDTFLLTLRGDHFTDEGAASLEGVLRAANETLTGHRIA